MRFGVTSEGLSPSSATSSSNAVTGTALPSSPNWNRRKRRPALRGNQQSDRDPLPELPRIEHRHEPEIYHAWVLIQKLPRSPAALPDREDQRTSGRADRPFDAGTSGSASWASPTAPGRSTGRPAQNRAGCCMPTKPRCSNSTQEGQRLDVPICGPIQQRPQKGRRIDRRLRLPGQPQRSAYARLPR